MWSSQQARSSTRPGPGLASCGEAGAEGSLLQAGEGVREGNGGGVGKRKAPSETGMAYGDSSSDTEWEEIYSQRKNLPH